MGVEQQKSIFQNKIEKKSNGQGSQKKIYTSRENCGKVKFSQGVAIDRVDDNYVIICEFTGVAAKNVVKIVKSSTSEQLFWPLPRAKNSGSGVCRSTG